MGVDSKTRRRTCAQHLYVLQAYFEAKYLFSGVLGHYDSRVYAETRPGDVASSGILLIALLNLSAFGFSLVTTKLK